MQGVQPKGKDGSNQSIAPIGNTIKSLFPHYLKASRLGGPKRDIPLNVEELNVRDLEAAMMDVRANAHKIYDDIADEYSYLTDVNRSIQREWLSDARDDVRVHQHIVDEYLVEKYNRTPEPTYDEIMYQDKEEAAIEHEVEYQ